MNKKCCNCDHISHVMLFLGRGYYCLKTGKYVNPEYTRCQRHKKEGKNNGPNRSNN